MEFFWIDPVALEKNTVDGGVEERRHERSVDSEEPEEKKPTLTDSTNSFIRSLRLAYLQLEDLKNHVIFIQYPSIRPEALKMHKLEFLSTPDEPLVNDESCLRDIQHYLQKFAVAFYHVIKEVQENESEAEYLDYLMRAKDKMVRMLIDIQLALMSTDVRPHPIVTYDMLPKSFTILPPGLHLRGMRDFMLVRDYSVLLEYIIKQKSIILSLPS